MYNYISLHLIMDNLALHPLLKDLHIERVADYAQKFLRILDVPKSYQEKIAEVEVKDYRGQLPCDLHSIVLIRNEDRVLRYSTDSFHLVPTDKNIELTYKVQGRVIFTSLLKANLVVVYKSIVTDEDGFPMIPDHAAFINAFENYIKCQQFTMLFDMGKISLQSLQNAQLEYAWAVGLALSSMIMPSLDLMQSITNDWNSLINNTNHHKTGFIIQGALQKIRRK